MKRLIAPILLFLALPVFPGQGLPIELGAIAGGGLCLTFGSYLDAKAADLAAQGAVGAAAGTTEYRLFPGTSAGVYGEIGLQSWLDLRLELRASYLGASRLALTGAAAPMDAYGVGFYSLMVPVLARASFSLGPGSAFVDLGPFYGLVIGGVHVQDTYALTRTSAQVKLTFLQASTFGLSGGVGYSLALGPGVASVELRADWTLFPAKLDTGLGSGDLLPLNVLMVLGYGFTLGSRN